MTDERSTGGDRELRLVFNTIVAAVSVVVAAIGFVWAASRLVRLMLGSFGILFAVVRGVLRLAQLAFGILWVVFRLVWKIAWRISGLVRARRRTVAA